MGTSLLYTRRNRPRIGTEVIEAIGITKPNVSMCVQVWAFKFSFGYTVHFGYSGHLRPLSGHYIRLATISDLNIIE